MKWGLTQGIIGRDTDSLAPSTAAVGPNTYLSQGDFLKMLGVALALHLVVFIIAGMFPDEKVTNIPVRALSFKLGDQDRIAAYSPSVTPATTPQISAPTMQATAEERFVAPLPVPVKPQKIETLPKPKPQPQLKPLPAEPAPVRQAPVAQPMQPAIAPQPQQYVREVGQPLAPLPKVTQGTPEGAIGGAGVENTQTEQTKREIRERYEQQISGWIERHKLYPVDAGGRAGRVIVRMRIDRGGAVRYYALEQSSGIPALDAAAIDMVRRANPLPAAPVNYPEGNLIEFLIPINFQAPQ
jgi:periplasmic protein TonB